MTTTDTRAALDVVLAAIDTDTQVARALAAAPGVEEAIADIKIAACDFGIAQHRISSEAHGRNCAETHADRRSAAGDMRRADNRLRAAIAADRARAVAEARPAPDEARRLVDEAIDAVRSIHDRADPYRQPAVTALLRALGVES